MTCAACSARVEKAVSGVSGVSSCTVILLTNSMTVIGNTKDSEIEAAVIKAGYGIANNKNNSTDESETTYVKALKNRLISSLVFLIMLMYISMGYTMWGLPQPQFLDKN